MPSPRATLSSTLLIACLLAGCSAPAPTGGRITPAHPNLPPGGNLISSGSGQLVANNSGGLTGTVMGPPASLIANNAGSLVANNGSALISNNSGGLIANNSGGYKVLNLGQYAAPIARASVTIVDENGTPVTDEPVKTQLDGTFSIPHLKASRGLLFVKATYTPGGRAVSLIAAVAAPRQAGMQTTSVDPSTTFTAKKLIRMIRQGALDPASVKPETIAAMAASLAPLLNAQGVAAACLLQDDQAAKAFDAIVASSKPVADTLQSSGAGAATLIAKTPDTPIVRPPAANPGSSAPPTGGPSGTGSGSVTSQASAQPSEAPVATASSAPTTSTPSEAPAANPTPAPAPDPGLGLVAGDPSSGDPNAAIFTELNGIAVGTDGKVYVADGGSNQLIAVDPVTGAATIAGNGSATGGFGGDGGPAVSAQLSDPSGVAIAPDGTLYVSDTGNNRIRAIHPDGSITTVAGGGNGKDDGAGTSLLLNAPAGLALGADGSLYFVENGNDRPRRKLRRLDTNGQVTTLASGFPSPLGALALDAAHDLLWLGVGNDVDRLTGISGTPGKPDKVYSATGAHSPLSIMGLAFDPAGSLYALQSFNDANKNFGTADAVVMRLPVAADGTVSGTPSAIAGSGATGTSSDYMVPARGKADPKSQLIAGDGTCALTIAHGILYLNSTYKTVNGTTTTHWSQVLRVKP